MNNKRTYEFVVEGQYIALSGSNKTLKKYSVKFVLPSPDSALSVIVSKLLDDKLRLTYDDYVKYRTHKIVGRSIVGEKPSRAVLEMEVEKMNFEELTDFCLLKEISVDPFKYKNVQLAREAVAKGWEDQKERGREILKDKEKIRELDELRLLNNIPTGDSAPVYTKAPDAPLSGAPGANDDASAQIS